MDGSDGLRQRRRRQIALGRIPFAHRPQTGGLKIARNPREGEVRRKGPSLIHGRAKLTQDAAGGDNE